jgi:RNA polymerase-interacting CarD/CdnL/TRCF family regulator
MHEPKFKVGDKVERYPGDSVGTVVEIIIEKRATGERYVYRVEFGKYTMQYIACDLSISKVA